MSDVDGFMSTAPGLKFAFAFAIKDKAGPASAPKFETAGPALKWLERATSVGVAARTPDRVAVGFHEVL